MPEFKPGQRVKFDIVHPLEKGVVTGTGTVTYVDKNGPRIQPMLKVRPGAIIKNVRSVEEK